jgi:hypothetical protein
MLDQVIYQEYLVEQLPQFLFNIGQILLLIDRLVPGFVGLGKNNQRVPV